MCINNSDNIDVKTQSENILVFEAEDCNDPRWEVIINILEKNIPGFEVRYADGDWMNFYLPNSKEILGDYEKTTYWYAVMIDDDDDDWGYGSHDLKEAKQMVKELESDTAYIAVIDEADYPDCIAEIHQDEF